MSALDCGADDCSGHAADDTLTCSGRLMASTLDHDADELGNIQVAAYVHDNGDDPAYIVVDVDAPDELIKVTLNDSTIYDARSRESYDAALAEARRIVSVFDADLEFVDAVTIERALRDLVAALDA